MSGLRRVSSPPLKTRRPPPRPGCKRPGSAPAAWENPVEVTSRPLDAAAPASISGSDRKAQVILLTKVPRVVAADDAGKKTWKKTMSREQQDRCRSGAKVGGRVRKCCATRTCPRFQGRAGSARGPVAAVLRRG